MTRSPSFLELAVAARAERTRHVADVISQLITGFRAWRRRRIALSHLRELDDYLLNDIGLGRSEIGFATRHGRRPTR